MDTTLAGSHSMAFPLLSEQPVCPTTAWPEDPLIDSLTLNKTSENIDSKEKPKKNPANIMKDTEIILKFYLHQSKHQRAIQNELKGLLEHEKSILNQLLERGNKFSEMKEENKKRQDEWESDHKNRMSVYSKYLTDLMEIPESQSLTQDGIPGEVEQKMLYNIVDSTCNVANNAVVQLSVQNTLVNDVDLSLTKLKQFCNLMLKHIDNWLKSLSTEIPNSKKVREQWSTIHHKIENLKSVPDEAVAAAHASMTAADFQKEMAKLIDRICKIEINQACFIDHCCQDVAPGNVPASEGQDEELFDSLEQGAQRYADPHEPCSQRYADPHEPCSQRYADSLETDFQRCGDNPQHPQTSPYQRYNTSIPYQRRSPEQSNPAAGSDMNAQYGFQPRIYSSPNEEFQDFQSCSNRSRHQ